MFDADSETFSGKFAVGIPNSLLPLPNPLLTQPLSSTGNCLLDRMQSFFMFPRPVTTIQINEQDISHLKTKINDSATPKKTTRERLGIRD